MLALCPLDLVFSALLVYGMRSTLCGLLTEADNELRAAERGRERGWDVVLRDSSDSSNAAVGNCLFG